MKKCGNCGVSVQGHWCFCPSCGQPIKHVKMSFDPQAIFLDAPQREIHPEICDEEGG